MNLNRKNLSDWLIVIASFLAMLVVGVKYIFGLFIPHLSTEFGWSSAEISLAFSLSFLFTTFLAFLMGRASDRYGIRKVMVVGAVLVSAGYFLAGGVQSLLELYLAFTFIGIGCSALYVPPVSTLSRWVEKRRGLATGIAITALSIGLVSFSPLAQVLISGFGWRSTFYIFGAFIAVILSFSILLTKQKVDAVEWSRPTSEKTKSLDCDLNEAMRRKSFWYFYSTLALACFGVFAVIVHVVPFAIRVGAGEFQAGIALFLIGLFSILARILGGWAAERVGVLKMLTVFLCVQAVSTVVLLVAGKIFLVYLGASGVGIAWGGWAAAYPLTLRKLFGAKNLGAVMGVYETGIGIGGMTGPAVVGYIFDFSKTYILAFLLCCFVDLLAILLSVMLKKTGLDRLSGLNS